MAKAKAAPVTDSILDRTARNAVVASFVSALNANETSGTLIHTVCETANRYLKGKDLPDADRKAITADIAKARGWKGPTLTARSSEVNVVLRAYAQLPEAIKAYRAKFSAIQWHDSMKLARRLNAGDTIPQAVKAVSTKAESAKVPASGRVASALKAWYKESPRKRADILKAATLLNIKLGVKLDA